jgi:hypothetical protein
MSASEWYCPQELHALAFLTAQVIASVTGNRDCVADIAESSVLVYLLFSLQTLPSGACVPACVCLCMCLCLCVCVCAFLLG